MITIALAFAFGALPPSTNAHWLTSYSAAYEQAGKEDKPIFLYFTNESDRVDGAKAVADLPGLKNFVAVFVSKRTEEGRKLFKMFELNTDDASVVIDRSRAWQFFRYERKLDHSEVEKVLNAGVGVRGVPMLGSDPLVRISAYTPADSQAKTGAVVPQGQLLLQPNFGSGWNSGSSCPSCNRGFR